MSTTLSKAALAAALILTVGCKKEQTTPPPATKTLKVGLVTDVGGRGDHSFNDSALRGLELWAGGKNYQSGRYVEAPATEVQASLPADLAARLPPIAPVGVTPLILQSKAQEDYEPNLQLVVDQGAGLTIGVGYMMENAVEAIARRNPEARFLLIDSPVMDKGTPVTLPNVRTVVFREEQGSFLVGALAGLVTQTGKVGFVGGIEVPLIKKFEAGFRAGVATTRPEAASTLLVNYTGSFDNVAAGKQVTQDLLSKGVDVVFHAAGSDGLGVIQAVKEARAAGKAVYVIGVDSDQAHLAPEAVLTSMVKRVDLAVYEAARDLAGDKWTAGDRTLGLAEGGVAYAPVRVPLANKEAVLAKVEALRERIIQGQLQVPQNATELAAFKVAP
ncbi:MAG: BMP family ABC transporter substrate-binding protein [Myxococcota bacterium]|nr:BMP family ABC transporter substrate-binding protein [Myxococcota bacterium]